MGQRFISCDREQALLLPPDLREWLPEDHLAWFVLDTIDVLGLDAFYAYYRADGRGRPAHDPQMMLSLVVYAYAVGERSSRAIERRCQEDIAFRVIAANQTPDHATIARFRVRHEQALGEIFSQVLGLCAQAGLVEVGVIAVDGTKLAAMASDSAVRTYEQIAKEILQDASAVDAAEDEQFGDKRGDELPEGLRSSGDRRARLREAKQALDAQRTSDAKPVPRGRAERLAECRRRLEQDHELERRVIAEHRAWRKEGIASDGSRRMSGGHILIEDPAPQAPAGKINTTDPDARRMKSGRTFIPAYNAQAVSTQGQIIVAAEITTEGGDFQQLDPMISSAERELSAAGITQPPGVVVADAGYWANGHIDALRSRGIIPVIAPDSDRNAPRKTRSGGPYDFMRRVLATEAGSELYAKRQWMIEPVFAQIKSNRGIDHFRRRGRAAARSEWRLIAATHNLLKLHRHSISPVTA